MIEKLKSYVKPESLTFWAGMALVASGIFQLVDYCVIDCGVFGSVVDGLFGSAGAASRIAIGAGMVGLRRAVDSV